MTVEPALWRAIEDRLRPFVARRVSDPDVDDVLQEVFVRMQRGLADLRDEERFSGWMFQIARNAIADHGRVRARHPLTSDAQPPESDSRPHDAAVDEDRAAFSELAGCVAKFVARLPSPYREAVTLVELEGLTAREAAERAGVSVSGMKSRVQRGRAQLRDMFEECCAIALDARNKVVEVTERPVDADAEACRCPSTR